MCTFFIIIAPICIFLLYVLLCSPFFNYVCSYIYLSTDTDPEWEKTVNYSFTLSGLYFVSHLDCSFFHVWLSWRNSRILILHSPSQCVWLVYLSSVLGAHLLFSFHSTFVQKISFVVVRLFFVAMVLLLQLLQRWDKSFRIGFYKHEGAAGWLHRSRC